MLPVPFPTHSFKSETCVGSRLLESMIHTMPSPPTQHNSCQQKWSPIFWLASLHLVPQRTLEQTPAVFLVLPQTQLGNLSEVYASPFSKNPCHANAPWVWATLSRVVLESRGSPPKCTYTLPLFSSDGSRAVMEAELVRTIGDVRRDLSHESRYAYHRPEY